MAQVIFNKEWVVERIGLCEGQIKSYRLKLWIEGVHFSKSAISYGWKVGMERAKNRTRDPYQSRHTYACWSLSAGANPSFIASQMGHEDARMVYEVYSKWIGDMNSDQVDMLNSRMPTAVPPGCPKAKYLLKKVL
ncbi:excisionase family protein [Enterobacter ludwigii]